MARSMSAPTHIWTGSALSIPAASGPSSFNVNRAMDWALYNERAADSGVRDGNSASRADSRLIRRPGLMSTSWHSRRALGRGHEHIRRSPMVTANRPSSWTLIANGLPSCWARVAATLNIVSRWSPQASGGQPIAEMSCPPRWQTTRRDRSVQTSGNSGWSALLYLSIRRARSVREASENRGTNGSTAVPDGQSPNPTIFDKTAAREPDLLLTNGAPCRNRTDDTSLTMAVLCRLS